MSVINIVTCLHPKCCAYDPITETLINTMLFDYPTAPCGYYCHKILKTNNKEKDDDIYETCHIFDKYGIGYVSVAQLKHLILSLNE
ncbi:unnamed protein product [Rotaria sordida]|uniref:EF-hand domain-containing protein n=1 Tax=Rotaria sordida TaxID=392033 RepID=A0A814LQ43_9BILA|nr:unnamed protein product [Rotaria sordida]